MRPLGQSHRANSLHLCFCYIRFCATLSLANLSKFETKNANKRVGKATAIFLCFSQQAMRADKEKKVKSGGSTLKRLKTTLRSAGVIGSIKKRNAKPADRAEKLKKITDRVNPFELKVTRQKHDVLGRKIKGAVGKPGVTRQVGHENVRG